jgi:hypothetical protein
MPHLPGDAKKCPAQLYLSQQAEPSAGWAQHAPPLSSLVSLGVQQTAALFFGAQQGAAATVSLFSNFDFLMTGMSESIVSIVFAFLS